MTLVLDAGALIALERGDASMWRRYDEAQRAGRPRITHGGVVGQVWRGGPRQARLAAALMGIDVVPLDDRLGRAAGQLMRAAKSSDVVDAALVLLASDDDDIVTSDPDDIRALARATGRRIGLIAA